MTNAKDISKRQARREEIRRKEQRSRLIGLGLIIIGVLFVAFLIVYPSLKPAAAIIKPEVFARPNADFNAAGNPDAPIRIEEYSDFQCSHCAGFYRETEKELMDTFVADGSVYFVYNSFGSFMGPDSALMAGAAYCAGDQGKFWEMHDVILSNQGNAQGTPVDQRMVDFAKFIDLDSGDFEACLNDDKHGDLVAQDMEDGTANGIKATPTFVLSYSAGGEVKMKLIEGSQPYDVFKQEIETALAEIGQ